MDIGNTCYLFLDFDGTVFIDGVIPEENRSALHAVQKHGHQLILCTGRSRGGLNLDAEHHKGVDWDGMIFGASDISFRGHHIHKYVLSETTARKWVEYCMDVHESMVLECEKKNLWYLFKEHTEKFTVEERETVFSEIHVFLKDNPLTKLSVMTGTVAPGRDLGECSLVFQERYTEVFPKGRDKGAAVLDLCREFDLPLEQCVCFGDSFNDLAMFRVCPNSVCMNHSPDILKQNATYCAKEFCGVAEGIRKLFGYSF